MGKVTKPTNEPTQVQLRKIKREREASNERQLSKIAAGHGELGRNPQAMLDASNRLSEMQSSYDNEIVVFKHTPIISETRSSEYVDAGLPGETGIVVYTVTNNRRFTINCKFISRSVPEAIENFGYVNMLRSWLIPPMGKDYRAGGSPPLLALSGYGYQFYQIPVQLSEVGVSYPDDVDYINCGKYMVPIIQTVDLSLIETHDLKVRSGVKGEADGSAGGSGLPFDLDQYKAGTLQGW